MSEMIERMAEAAYEEGCRRAMAAGIMPSGPVPWADMIESSRQNYRDTARAMLRVARAPTDAMLAVGDFEGVLCWRRMIDEALK